MSNKYMTNNYMVILFDRYGTKIDTVSMENSGLLQAIEQGRDCISKELCSSFCIVRVLYNSLDANGF